MILSQSQLTVFREIFLKEKICIFYEKHLYTPFRCCRNGKSDIYDDYCQRKNLHWKILADFKNKFYMDEYWLSKDSGEKQHYLYFF